MFGIILTSLGGIASIISLIFLISEENNSFGIIIGVGVFIFLIGLILIFSSKTNIYSTQRNSEKSNSVDIGALKQLSELKDKGIITEEEFDAKKKKILGS
ncbi:MAG: SHOCT domain-containing protein [Bacteroidales bacterium]|nr:SHOCT domain-containing protein [Bacteroidales bacterium]